jgi:hypothetical protein
VEGSGPGLNEGTILALPGWTEKNQRNFSQGSRCPGQDMNPGPPNLLMYIKQKVTDFCFSCQDI